MKVIPIIDVNLFKGKDITFGLVFRPTIKEIINEKENDSTLLIYPL